MPSRSHTRYLSSILALVSQSIIVRFLGMFVSVILARGMGPINLGIFNVIQNTSQTVFGIGKFGVDTAMHVGTARREENRNSDLGELFGTGLLLFLILGILGSSVTFFLAPLLAVKLFHDPSLTVWVRLAAPFVLVQFINQFCYSALAGVHAFGAYARIMVIGSILNLIGITIALLADGLLMVVLATFSVNFYILISLSKILYRELKSRHIHIIFTKYYLLIQEILKVGLPYYTAGLFSLLVNYYLYAYIIQNSGIESSGYLRIITSLTAIISFIPGSIAAATTSHLASVKGGCKKEDNEYIKTAIVNIKYIWMFCLLISLVVYSILPSIVHFLYGYNYTQAINPAGLAFVGVSLIAAENIMVQAYFADSRSYLIMTQALSINSIFLALAIFLVPDYGLTGYMLSRLGAYMIVLTVVMISLQPWIRKQGCRLSDLWALLFMSLVASFSMVTIIYFGGGWKSNVLAGFSLISLLAVIMYKITIEEERNLFVNIIKNNRMFSLLINNKFSRKFSNDE